MKNLCCNSGDKAGYTLVELVVVAAVIMFAGIFLLRLSGSIAGRTKFSNTDNRMDVIEAKIRQYYLAHELLPTNVPPLAANEIPVDINSLDLEQKYRLDDWGQFFQYNTGAVTNLQDVDGRAVSIESGGPDQDIGTVNDNIVKYIDLSVEAGQIVRKKLKLLMEKVATYDALFAGVDNDGVYGDAPDPNFPNRNPDIDEDPLDGAVTSDVTCPPVAGFSNDPASGLPTLDNIEMAMDGLGGNAYSCATGSTLSSHLATYYHLRTGSPGGYDIDPWNNSFKWGYIGRTLDDGNTIDDSMDAHFHKFFSSGPDQTSIDDDIIYQN